MSLSLSWEQVREHLCQPYKAGGAVPQDFTETAKQRNTDFETIKNVANALVGQDEVYLFISERNDSKAAALWGLASDLAFSAHLGKRALFFNIYKPSRDFGKVTLTESNADGEPRTLVVKVEGNNETLRIELQATGENCNVLYGALPYLLGRSRGSRGIEGEGSRGTA